MWKYKLLIKLLNKHKSKEELLIPLINKLLKHIDELNTVFIKFNLQDTQVFLDWQDELNKRSVL